jgi:arylsulfatase A-like enzyme
VQPPIGLAVDGKRLDRLLTGQTDPQRDEIFLMHYPHSPHRSDYFTVYREGDWKVIYHYFPTEVSGGSHYQLFNLKQDPFEQSDLAASEPHELRRMMQRLTLALKESDAVYPLDASGEAVLPVVP